MLSTEAERLLPARYPDFLSWDFPKIAPPPYLPRESCPGFPPRKVVHLRPGVAKHPTPSALVVLPDSDGLLLTTPCRSIAPCYQPWGSSRFLPRLQHPVSRLCTVLVAIPGLAVHTLRSVSLTDSRTASPQPLPPRCWLGALHARLPHRSASNARFKPVCRFPQPVLPPLLFRCPPRPQPRGLAPSVSPLPPHCVATMPPPDAPLGFVPLQGAPLNSGVS